ncbi:hypothetical protein [Kitasatospora sp. KL5]
MISPTGAQLPEETVFEDEQLGRWVRAQRGGWLAWRRTSRTC